MEERLPNFRVLLRQGLGHWHLLWLKNFAESFFHIIDPSLQKRLRSGDMAVFASLDDRGCLLSTENAPVVLDTARIVLIHEALPILFPKCDS